MTSPNHRAGAYGVAADPYAAAANLQYLAMATAFMYHSQQQQQQHQQQQRHMGGMGLNPFAASAGLVPPSPSVAVGGTNNNNAGGGGLAMMAGMSMSPYAGAHRQAHHDATQAQAASFAHAIGSSTLAPMVTVGNSPVSCGAFAATSTTPLRGISTNSGLSTPVRQKTQPQTERAGRLSGQAQHPSRDPITKHAEPMTSVAGCHAVTNRRLEKELSDASKEELLQILLELSYFSPEAATFIDNKCQIFALRPRASTAAAVGSTAASLDATNASSEQLMESVGTAADGASHSSGAAAAGAPDLALSASPASAANPPTAATPQMREFRSEKHPCVHLFGACRFASTCVFANAPANLCVAYVRGQCPNGNDCTLVHRLPEDASDALKQLHGVQVARNAAQQASAASFGGTMSTSRPQRIFNSATPLRK